MRKCLRSSLQMSVCGGLSFFKFANKKAEGEEEIQKKNKFQGFTNVKKRKS